MEVSRWIASYEYGFQELIMPAGSVVTRQSGVLRTVPPGKKKEEISRFRDGCFSSASIEIRRVNGLAREV